MLTQDILCFVESGWTRAAQIAAIVEAIKESGRVGATFDERLLAVIADGAIENMKTRGKNVAGSYWFIRDDYDFGCERASNMIRKLVS